jgi:hypothetical protein
MFEPGAISVLRYVHEIDYNDVVELGSGAGAEFAEAR